MMELASAQTELKPGILEGELHCCAENMGELALVQQQCNQHHAQPLLMQADFSSMDASSTSCWCSGRWVSERNGEQHQVSTLVFAPNYPVI